jgi:hypothetical protein
MKNRQQAVVKDSPPKWQWRFYDHGTRYLHVPIGYKAAAGDVLFSALDYPVDRPPDGAALAKAFSGHVAAVAEKAKPPDPVAKLRAFLAANPDVTAILK